MVYGRSGFVQFPPAPDIPGSVPWHRGSSTTVVSALFYQVISVPAVLNVLVREPVVPQALSMSGPLERLLVPFPVRNGGEILAHLGTVSPLRLGEMAIPQHTG